MNIWLTSDNHFGHKGSLSWTDNEGNLLRGAKFSSVEEMDEFMIERWNSVVKPGDKVYHLGDVFMGNNEEDFKKIWSRLNGKKRVFVGNHDDIKMLARNTDVRYWKIFSDEKIILTHVPLHPSNTQIYLKEGDYQEGDCGKVQRHMFNVHGHIHHNPSPEGPYMNICVEQTDYTPIHFDEVLKAAREYNESHS